MVVEVPQDLLPQTAVPCFVREFVPLSLVGKVMVVTDTLADHVRTLSGLVGELRAVHDPVAGVSVTAEAYGEIGRRAANAIDVLGEVGRHTMRDGVAALESAATELRATVVTYGQQEAEGVNLYTDLDEALERLPGDGEGWSSWVPWPLRPSAFTPTPRHSSIRSARAPGFRRGSRPAAAWPPRNRPCGRSTS